MANLSSATWNVPTHTTSAPLIHPHITLTKTPAHPLQRNYYFINHNELLSDHNPIHLSINNFPITSGSTGINKATNWKKYASYIENNISKNFSKTITETIDLYIINFSTIIQSAIDNSSIPKKLNNQQNLSPDLLLEIETKFLLRKEWPRTRNQ